MPDTFIQAAPNSTGEKLRFYRRGVSGTEGDQYVITTQDRVVSAVGYASTFRIPARALASQPLFTLENKTGSTTVVAVRRLTAEIQSIAAKIVLEPVLRLYRSGTAPTLGTVISKGTGAGLTQSDTADTQNANVEARCDASADGTNSASALAVTVANPFIWQQTVPRWHTLVGQGTISDYSLLPNDSDMNASEPLILRAAQNLVVRMETPAALVAADFHLFIKCAWEEFTRP